MLKYLKFLIRSTNQHGVHSPFVYAYVTRGLYRGRKYRGPVHRRILFRTIGYFKPERICIIDTSDKPLLTSLKKYFPGITLKPVGASEVTAYNKPLHPDEVSLFLHETTFNDKHVLILEGIHRNAAAEKSWKAVKQNTGVRVTVDLFYAGVIFFRKGQAMEDFIIRP